LNWQCNAHSRRRPNPTHCEQSGRATTGIIADPNTNQTNKSTNYIDSLAICGTKNY